jgi:hypothetical protein
MRPNSAASCVSKAIAAKPSEGILKTLARELIADVFDVAQDTSQRRLVAFWLAKPPMQRSPDEQRPVEAVTTSHPQVATAEHLAQQFRQVFKDQDSDALKSWMGNKRSVRHP